MFKKCITFLSLFMSVGTLLCCALPALFVALGLGAAFAGFVGVFPQVIWLSENKLWIFGIGGLLLLVGLKLQAHAKTLFCPIEPAQSEVCKDSKDYSKIIYRISVALYLIGAFFAFIAPRIFS